MSSSFSKEQFLAGDQRTLARYISIVENELEGFEEILSNIPHSKTPVIGITGPPGAGKSSLISSLIKTLSGQGKKIAVIAVDPSSPFNKGALLGDRVRMSDSFTDLNIFIRSMASRGALGGLSPKIFDVVDLIKASGYDFVIIETVGVGQSEIEIASLADTTILVLVPEAGDEVQTLKSGIMEIADIYVLNKSDREGSDIFYKNLKALAHTNAKEYEAAVIKTIATNGQGIPELLNAINEHSAHSVHNEKKYQILLERAVHMIRDLRTKDINAEQLLSGLKSESKKADFNLYRFVKRFI